MAKANGIVKIDGTIDDLTFYKLNGKSYVRKKGGVSRERIMNDPNFARTRENMSEFAESGRAGKILRQALGMMVYQAKDNRLSSRLSGVMSLVKNQDMESARGRRTVANGIMSDEGKLLLEGFDFNIRSNLNAVLHAPYTVDLEMGSINIKNLVTQTQILYPHAATNVSFQSAIVDVSFATGQYDISYSEKIDLPISMEETNIDIKPGEFSKNYEVQILVLLLTFSQETNRVLYPLKNEDFNVLQVIKVF